MLSAGDFQNNFFASDDEVTLDLEIGADPCSPDAQSKGTQLLSEQFLDELSDPGVALHLRSLVSLRFDLRDDLRVVSHLPGDRLQSLDTARCTGHVPDRDHVSLAGVFVRSDGAKLEVGRTHAERSQELVTAIARERPHELLLIPEE